jgi:ketosteroid isomerase-like protein
MSDDSLASVRRAIRERSDLFEAFFAAGDAAGLVESYYVEAPMLSAPDAPLVRGREAIRAVFETLIQTISTARLEQVEVGVSGDLAYEVGRCELTMKDASEAPPCRYLIAWRNTPAGWRAEVDCFAYGPI